MANYGSNITVFRMNNMHQFCLINDKDTTELEYTGNIDINDEINEEA